MYSPMWDHSTRIVPTRYDSDFWRASPRWEVNSFPREFSSFPRETSFSRELAPFPRETMTREYVAPLQSDFSSSLATYPVRERSSRGGEMEREMSRMNEEMGKMFQSMQKSQPLKNVDDWRLTENFRMENPIQTFQDGSRKFHLQFDMRQFKPEEIQVKTSGNTLSVAAKHDEKDPNKAVYREYNRSYVIPKGVSPEALSSKLSADGILTIEAPLPSLEGPREKLIAIKHN